MQIRVKKISNDSVWYSECIGQVFNVFTITGRYEYWFSFTLFFFPEDVEVTTDTDGYVPCINTIGIT